MISRFLIQLQVTISNILSSCLNTKNIYLPIRMLNSTLKGYKYGEKFSTIVIIARDPIHCSLYKSLISINLEVSPVLTKKIQTKKLFDFKLLPLHFYHVLFFILILRRRILLRNATHIGNVLCEKK